MLSALLSEVQLPIGKGNRQQDAAGWHFTCGIAAAQGEIPLTSGHQELIENIVNQFLFDVRN